MLEFAYNGKTYITKTLLLLETQGIALKVPVEKLKIINKIDNDVLIVVANGDGYDVLAGRLAMIPNSTIVCENQKVRMLSKVVLKKALKPLPIPILRPDQWRPAPRPYYPRENFNSGDY